MYIFGRHILEQGSINQQTPAYTASYVASPSNTQYAVESEIIGCDFSHLNFKAGEIANVIAPLPREPSATTRGVVNGSSPKSAHLYRRVKHFKSIHIYIRSVSPEPIQTPLKPLNNGLLQKQNTKISMISITKPRVFSNICLFYNSKF